LPLGRLGSILRRLGSTEIEVSPIGLGCWQFSGGGPATLFWQLLSQSVVDDIVRTALENGINWFDTAELYGGGRSEKSLAKALSNASVTNGDVVIATKWNPILRGARSIISTFHKRQQCLLPFRVDLYQIHHPVAIATLRSQIDAMTSLMSQGKIKAVGVSNFSARLMRRSYELLSERGFSLASNQVKFNLLHRQIEHNGVLEAAKELNIMLIAYSPLAQGLLTGKFHKNPKLINDLPLVRRMQLGRMIEKTNSLVVVLEEIAKSHSCSISEVALSWVINYHGDSIIAIPGATKSEHVKQNAGAMSLQLSIAEMVRIDEVSRTIQL